MNNETEKQLNTKIPDPYTLDYYQGYFDCLSNVTSQLIKLKDELEDKLKINSEITHLVRKDARQWETNMYEALKEKYGENLKVTPFGKYYIENYNE